MQWVSPRIWTRVAVFISYDDKNYIQTDIQTENKQMTYAKLKCLK